VVVLVLLALAAFVLSACGASSSTGTSGEGGGSTAGAGSTAQERVQGHWTEEFEREEPSVKLAYDAVGSGAGRQRFIAGDAAYAASDIPLEGAELQRAVKRCEPGQLVEVPAYLSKIFVPVHVGHVAFLNLTPETLAKVFEGKITSWSDPEIRGANQPIAKRLNGPIRVIYPAGESGTTANFTAYLSEAVPNVWRHGSSEVWPVPGVGTSVDSETAMLKALNAREGTIAFIDASWSGPLKPVLIKTGSDVGDVAVPNHGSSITTLENSPEAKKLKKSPYMMPFDLERGYGERGTYPIVFTSYLIACTAYDSDEEAATVRGLLSHAVGSRGQEVAGTETGADPLIGDLQKRAEAAVAAIE